MCVFMRTYYIDQVSYPIRVALSYLYHCHNSILVMTRQRLPFVCIELATSYFIAHVNYLYEA